MQIACFRPKIVLCWRILAEMAHPKNGFKTGQKIRLRHAGGVLETRIVGVEGELVFLNPGPGCLLTPGEVVEITFAGGNRQFVYYMQVLRPSTRLGRDAVLRRNPNATYNGTRRGWRVQAGIKATIRKMGAVHGINGVIENIGAEGALVISPCRLQSGNTVILQIQLPELGTIEVEGLVCRTAPAPKDELGEECTAAGIAFSRMSRRHHVALIYYIWNRIREGQRDAIRRKRPVLPSYPRNRMKGSDPEK